MLVFSCLSRKLALNILIFSPDAFLVMPKDSERLLSFGKSLHCCRLKHPVRLSVKLPHRLPIRSAIRLSRI